ncbi:hypothetical protein Tdes44962_MAKER09985, partial [Teratosphaeria destructans]
MLQRQRSARTGGHHNRNDSHHSCEQCHGRSDDRHGPPSPPLHSVIPTHRSRSRRATFYPYSLALPRLQVRRAFEMSSRSRGKRPAPDEHPFRIKQEFRESPSHTSSGTLAPEQPPPSIPDDPSTPSAGDANVVHTGHNQSVHAQTRMPSLQAQGRESMTVDAFLDSSDHEDIRLLPHCSPASSRCQDFITSFVNRALLRGQAPGKKAFPSALEYFNLIEAELRKANMDPERVDATRGTMISLWQERLVALVGATVTTPERLERLVEVMSKGAEELGGVPGVRFVARWFACGRGGETDLLDSLQDSLDAGDGADDQPRTTASDTGDPPMDLSDGRLRQRGDSVGDVAPHEQDHDALGHGRPQQQDPIVSSKHIKDAPDFFTYHARKARRKHGGAGDEPRDSAVNAPFNGWRSLPDATQKAWVELFCRWQMGEKSLLKHKSVAHLFDGGRACEPPGRPPVDEGYASGSLPQSSAGRQADDGARETGVVRSQRPPSNARPPPETPPQPVARPQSTPRPHKQLFREIADPHRTIFLRVPGVTNAQTVAMACRVAAGGLDSSTAYTDAYTIGQGNFVITFREVLAARRVATGHVNVACPQKTRPGNVVGSFPLLYPPTEPRVFVTR